MRQYNNNEFSDYGSVNTSESSAMSMGAGEQWGKPDIPVTLRQNKQKASSLVDLMMGRCTLDDVMQEFKMNGSDSPYNPEDENFWAMIPTDELSGMGHSGAYLRQKSWPEPERTPIARLPRRFVPVDTMPAALVPETASQQFASDVITPEQLQVLSTLPNAVLYSLLRDIERVRGDRRAKKKYSEECRFCRNNGEREAYYRTHQLKDAQGRVVCPVLRAFVCRRCGARGDRAHTIKYCPFSTNEERMKSTAMMRSVRLASGRRRSSPPEYVLFGEGPNSLQENAYAYGETEPLDPLWAALEQKLML